MTRPDRPVQLALFDVAAEAASEHRGRLDLEPGAVVLRAFAVEEAPALLAAIDQIAQFSPWRHMTTVRGWRMSVAMTNCGDAGWLSDRSGYRYDAIDPQTVWGGSARLNFHGVDTLKPHSNGLTGQRRFNLTLRRAK